MKRAIACIFVFLFAFCEAQAVTITNLTSSATTISPQLWRLLTWTSAGGTANDIRCAHTDITNDATFAAAWAVSRGLDQTAIDGDHPHGAFVSTEPAPKANGQADSYVIVGLRPNTTYFCAMKTDGGTLSASTTFTTSKYEGYGYQSLGGGEQAFCEVTNTNDSGTGSLRACIGANKYTVFSVGGQIEMASAMDFRLDNVTIDGSTAPSPGVTLHALSPCLNNGLMLGSCSTPRSHQIMTYLRFLGNDQWGVVGCSCPCAATCKTDCGSCESCEDLTGLVGAGSSCPSANATHVVFDHITSWRAGDTGLNLSGVEHDVTVSNTMIAMGSHPFYVSPSTASAAQSARISIHHNLMARNADRNPFIVFDHDDIDMRSNVIYDYAYDPQGTNRGYGSVCCGMHIGVSGGPVNINIVSNYFRPFQCIGVSGCAVKDTKALYYGSGPGNDCEEGSTCLGGTNPGAKCPSTCTGGVSCAGGGVCQTYTGCKKQGTTWTGSQMGDMWVAGNVLPANNCDEYSTRADVRPVPGAAGVTTDVASSLWTTVLPGVGTIFRTTEEQALIDTATLDIGPRTELLVDGGFETGALGSPAVAGAIYQQNSASCGSTCPDPVVVSRSTDVVRSGTYSMKVITAAVCSDFPDSAPCGPPHISLTGLNTANFYTLSGYFLAQNLALDETSAITLDRLLPAPQTTLGSIAVGGLGSWLHFYISFQPLAASETYQLTTTGQTQLPGAPQSTVYFDDLSIK